MNYSDPILIYGAGVLGREILTYLRGNNTPPAGFVDQRATELLNVEGIPVYSLATAHDQFKQAKVRVVIAIHNFQVPVSKVHGDLTEAGFSHIETLWQFCQSEKWLPDEPYWLAPHHDWRSLQPRINDAYNLLDDEESRKLFAELIVLRTHGDYLGLSGPDPETQYDVPELPDYSQPIRLIDCGAYDGDTIRSLLEKGNTIGDVIAFEPDQDNFKKLKSYLKTLNYGSAVNSGTFDRNGEIRFSGTGSGASHIDQSGDVVISTQKIDEVCADFSPNLIKMDVEGAEAASIRGAVNIIRSCRPALAISIYHKPEDLWDLILMVHQLDLNYQLYIRTHGQNGFDTVLYALPT